MGKKKIARLASLREDYERLGIKKGEIELWEDGHRTNGKFGEYEWWYFDAKLDDGSSLVIIAYSQPVTAGNFGYAPSMTFSLTKDGEHLADSAGFDIRDCVFSKDRCCVKLGKSSFEGEAGSYKIHYETEKVTADVTLTASTAPWRPETGRILFGEKKYFAWLPSIPEGAVEAEITIGGKTRSVKGTG